MDRQTLTQLTLRSETDLNKKFIASGLASLVVTASLVAGCTGQSSTNGNAAESNQQQTDTATLEGKQPIPGYTYSQIRQNLIEIENAEAQGAQSTSFFFTANGTIPIFSCPSIGMPIPNTASLSNPHQIVWGQNNAGPGVVDQMDPNGIYAPTSSDGTFVICIDNQGKGYLHYWEGPVEAVFAPAVWDEATHSIKVIGASTTTVTTGHK